MTVTTDSHPAATAARPGGTGPVKRWDDGTHLSRVSWIGQMLRTVAASMRRNTPLTVASGLCVCIALSVAGGAALVASGVNTATKRWQGGVETIVFLDPGIDADTALTVGAVLEQNPDVAALSYMNQQDAFDEFKELFGHNRSLVDTVTPSALPTSWRVTPTETAGDTAIAQLADGLRTDDGWVDGVYQVVFAKDTVETVMAASSTAQTVLLGFAGLLGAAGLLLTYAASKAAAHARKDELRVMRLVGSPRWLVRAPFILEGAFTGVVGAGFAVAVLHAVTWWANQSERVTSSVLTHFLIGHNDVHTVTALMLTAGGVCGMVGALTAVWRYVKIGDSRRQRVTS